MLRGGIQTITAIVEKYHVFMKSYREIKVASLAIVCLALLYYGFYFLKGVNLFSPVRTYVGQFTQLDGLTEQAPVFVRGYKVGQVDDIRYDFTQAEAFLITVSIDKHILLPQGTRMVLVADGLLGGKAIEIEIPHGASYSNENTLVSTGDTLPTFVRPGLIESVEQNLLAHVDSVVLRIDSLLADMQQQIGGDHIRQSLENVDRITTDLTVSSKDLRHLTHEQLPPIIDTMHLAVNNANRFMTHLAEADIKATIARIDTVAEQVSTVLTSTDGTLGMLLHDKALYAHVDSAVVSADSLLTDLKANPKRYVHFSVFGQKEKKKKK